MTDLWLLIWPGGALLALGLAILGLARRITARRPTAPPRPLPPPVVSRREVERTAADDEAVTARADHALDTEPREAADWVDDDLAGRGR